MYNMKTSYVAQCNITGSFHKANPPIPRQSKLNKTDNRKSAINVHANHIRDGRGNRFNLSCKLVPLGKVTIRIA